MSIRVVTLLSIVLLGGCFSINSDISVGDGETADRSLNTVNGSITIGSDATVNGSARTVNGSISVGRNSSVEHVETVNGKITLAEGVTAASLEDVNGNLQIGPGARVAGDAETVNGRIVLASESTVEGRVSAINGQIRLEGATAGSLVNVNGGMLLEEGSRVLGELRVDKPRGSVPDESVLVEIRADCEVVGPLIFERPVNLRIHESAEVGEIRGAEAQYFSG